MIEKENYENRGNFMNDYILEVCVDSAESALAAAKGGASRLELCQNLVIGGTTPGSKLFEVIRRQTTIPIHALIRPRFGDFCYTPYELEEIREEVAMYRELGAVAVSEHPEANIMATLLCKEMGIPLVVAKAKDKLQGTILEKV